MVPGIRSESPRSSATTRSSARITMAVLCVFARPGTPSHSMSPSVVEIR